MQDNRLNGFSCALPVHTVQKTNKWHSLVDLSPKSYPSTHLRRDRGIHSIALGPDGDSPFKVREIVYPK